MAHQVIDIYCRGCSSNALDTCGPTISARQRGGSEDISATPLWCAACGHITIAIVHNDKGRPEFHLRDFDDDIDTHEDTKPGDGGWAGDIRVTPGLRTF
ncbi:hypothetical protein [Nocardia cyriacigeorgica]|uniref:hypothetical protein n=1 Tax=Nocardia cyriacigeorgica TaxID=135487 RepID=UPI001894C6A6|nr:hypothetical protein [Nocardia cyriacigeorgica]MBF6161061.1 hypothetical protein [Nocardia cyriacigeorgica]MBF6199860.1 hypothetical protein [Nocardia cyriacigeorgica]